MEEILKGLNDKQYEAVVKREKRKVIILMAKNAKIFTP